MGVLVGLFDIVFKVANYLRDTFTIWLFGINTIERGMLRFWMVIIVFGMRAGGDRVNIYVLRSYYGVSIHVDSILVLTNHNIVYCLDI